MQTRIRYRRCLHCGRHRDEVGYVSSRGCCPECGDRRQLENVRQLVAHSGPWFEHWYERLRQAFEHPREPAMRELAELRREGQARSVPGHDDLGDRLAS